MTREQVSSNTRRKGPLKKLTPNKSSPAMATRSKAPSSPAMGTRSKKKLNL